MDHFHYFSDESFFPYYITIQPQGPWPLRLLSKKKEPVPAKTQRPFSVKPEMLRGTFHQGSNKDVNFGYAGCGTRFAPNALEKGRRLESRATPTLANRALVRDVPGGPVGRPG